MAPGAEDATKAPPSWLRATALVPYLAVVAADVYDGRLDTDGWALLLGLGLILWGPPVLRSVLRRE